MMAQAQRATGGTWALTQIPDFTSNGVTFQCWAYDGQRLIWRSLCGTVSAGRDGREFWGARKGGDRRTGFFTLKQAMIWASGARP